MINLFGYQYNSNFFLPKDLEEAKQIVFGHGKSVTKERWTVETEWNKNLFKSRNFLNKNSIVLDWGVGIGRLSKMIVDTWGCKVVGVDLHENMLNHAREYVNNNLFEGITVDEFKNNNTLKFTNVVAAWVFQHSINLDEDLSLIKDRMVPNGTLFTFNELIYQIPVIPLAQYPERIWFWNSEKVIDQVQEKFNLIEKGLFPSILNIPENQNGQIWAFLTNNKTA